MRERVLLGKPAAASLHPDCLTSSTCDPLTPPNIHYINPPPSSLSLCLVLSEPVLLFLYMFSNLLFVWLRSVCVWFLLFCGLVVIHWSLGKLVTLVTLVKLAKVKMLKVKHFLEVSVSTQQKCSHGLRLTTKLFTTFYQRLQVGTGGCEVNSATVTKLKNGINMSPTELHCQEQIKKKRFGHRKWCHKVTWTSGNGPGLQKWRVDWQLQQKEFQTLFVWMLASVVFIHQIRIFFKFTDLLSSWRSRTRIPHDPCCTAGLHWCCFPS